LALYGIYPGHGHSLSGELSERADLLKKRRVMMWHSAIFCIFSDGTIVT
jgi:hypothetical protein